MDVRRLKDQMKQLEIYSEQTKMAFFRILPEVVVDLGQNDLDEQDEQDQHES